MKSELVEIPSQAQSLPAYDAACRAVALAKTLDEAKDISDKAAAMKAYARQAKNRQLEIDAQSIRFAAERRIGELMAKQREAGLMSRGAAGNPGGQGASVVRDENGPTQPTLAEAGIDKHLADRARKLAAIPQDEFDKTVSEWRERVEEEGERVNANLLSSGERELRRRAEEENNKGIQSRTPIAPALDHYDVLVIDPPWPMKKIERDVRPAQTEFSYPTMTEAELASLHLPMAADCHVWLWTTHKFMPMAFRLLDGWGLKYVCAFVWHKPGGFQPIGLPQYNCEFALYARRGSPKFVTTKAFPTCFNAARGAHSEKPSEFYEVVRRVTEGSRLDMFNRRFIDGFEGWGNESV